MQQCGRPRKARAVRHAHRIRRHLRPVRMSMEEREQLDDCHARGEWESRRDGDQNPDTSKESSMPSSANGMRGPAFANAPPNTITPTKFARV